MKNHNKGITLIALVITIIVLLILAGVAISMLSGENGILKKAADAKEKTEVAQKQEETTLVDYELISHFTLYNSKYKCKHGYITGASPTENGGIMYAELASNLVKALPEGYSLYDIEIDSEYKIKVKEEAIEENDEVIKLKTGMVIKKDNKIFAKVVVFGDITGDGIPAPLDKTYLHMFLISEGTVRRFPEDESFYMAMDVNHDGIINLDDRNYLSGAVTPEDPNNPNVIVQNVEAKKIEQIIFTEE